MIELFFGLTSLVLSLQVLSGSLVVGQAVINAIVVALLIVLFIIDLRTLVLPDYFIILLCITVAALFLITRQNYIGAFWGLVIGAGFLLALWLATGQKGIGFGDVKLMVPLGVLFGVRGTIVLLFAAFMTGGLAGSFLLLTRRATLKTAIPFGPFLAGAAIMLILVPAITEYIWGLMW